MSDKIIIINSPDTNGKTRISINGIASVIPHNKKVSVTEAEMEVLQNAELGTASITTLNDDEDTEAEVSLVGASSLKDGTEGSSIQAPATPAATSNEPNPLVDAEDGTPSLKPGDVQLRGEDDKEGADPILADGTEHAPAGGQANGGNADATFLDRSISSMDSDIDGLNDSARIDALIAAEQKRNDPRSTLINKLEARKAALAG